MPQPADMLNLSFLSEYEQELIMAVLQRDEELRHIEEKRVRSERSSVAVTIRMVNYSCTLWSVVVLRVGELHR